MQVACPNCKNGVEVSDDELRKGVAKASCAMCDFAFVIRLGDPNAAKKSRRRRPTDRAWRQRAQGFKSAGSASSVAGEIGGASSPKFVGADTVHAVKMDPEFEQEIARIRAEEDARDTVAQPDGGIDPFKTIPMDMGDMEEVEDDPAVNPPLSPVPTDGGIQSAPPPLSLVPTDGGIQSASPPAEQAPPQPMVGQVPPAAGQVPVAGQVPPATGQVPVAGQVPPAAEQPAGPFAMHATDAHTQLHGQSFPTFFIPDEVAYEYELYPPEESPAMRVVGVVMTVVITLGLLLGLFVVARNNWSLDMDNADRMVRRAFGVDSPDRTRRDELRGLEADAPKISTITMDGEKVLVARGTVRNNDTRPRRFLYVKVSLRRYGHVTTHAEGPVANVFSDEELAEMTPRKLLARSNPAGQKGENANVAGGAKLPYLVVITRVPVDYTPDKYRAVAEVSRAELAVSR